MRGRQSAHGGSR